MNLTAAFGARRLSARRYTATTFDAHSGRSGIRSPLHYSESATSREQRAPGSSIAGPSLRQPARARFLPVRRTISRAGIARLSSNGDAAMSAESMTFVSEQVVDSGLRYLVAMEK
jgi:hypothetical protein